MSYKRGLLSAEISQINDRVSLSQISSYTSSSNTMENIHSINSGKYPVYDAGGIVTYIEKYDMDTDYIGIIKDGSGVGRMQHCKNQSSFIGTLGAITSIGCSTYYLYTVLQNQSFKRYITGATIPHIYYKDYKDMMIPFPKEYKRIQLENIFKYIDNLIAININVLIFLNKQKSALLQRLFI